MLSCSQAINAGDTLAVNLGLKLLKDIPSRISKEVEAYIPYCRRLCVTKACKLIRKNKALINKEYCISAQYLSLR